ncbi:AtpZ/AtpI family protein [Winogradskyella sp.]
MRFTGVALQMGLTIYAGNLLGVWLDSKFSSDKFEPSITLLAVFTSMYMVIAQVIKVSKD